MRLLTLTVDVTNEPESSEDYRVQIEAKTQSNSAPMDISLTTYHRSIEAALTEASRTLQSAMRKFSNPNDSTPDDDERKLVSDSLLALAGTESMRDATLRKLFGRAAFLLTNDRL